MADEELRELAARAVRVGEVMSKAALEATLIMDALADRMRAAGVVLAPGDPIVVRMDALVKMFDEALLRAGGR